MSGPHTPEPWKTVYRDDEDALDIDAAGPKEWGADVTLALGIGEANARRIVSCVNACAGFSDDELYVVAAHGGFIDQVRYNAKVTAQRDQLLSALKGMVRAARLTTGWHCTPPGANVPLVVAEQAIASVEARS